MIALASAMSQPVANPSEPQFKAQQADDETRFTQLQQALAQGWFIETPIYFRAQWFTGNQKKEGYYCILKRNKEVDLIVIPDSVEMRQFVKQRRLKVVAA